MCMAGIHHGEAKEDRALLRRRIKKTKKRQRQGSEIKGAGAGARRRKVSGWLDRSSTLSEVLRRGQQIGEGGEEGRIAKEAAGALQKFTRGPVHEHVKVEPGAHRWLPSRTSGAYVNPYARVRVIYVHSAEAAKILELAQVECRDTLYFTLNTRH